MLFFLGDVAGETGTSNGIVFVPQKDSARRLKLDEAVRGGSGRLCVERRVYVGEGRSLEVRKGYAEAERAACMGGGRSSLL